MIFPEFELISSDDFWGIVSLRVELHLCQIWERFLLISLSSSRFLDAFLSVRRFCSSLQEALKCGVFTAALPAPAHRCCACSIEQRSLSVYCCRSLWCAWFSAQCSSVFLSVLGSVPLCSVQRSLPESVFASISSSPVWYRCRAIGSKIQRY